MRRRAPILTAAATAASALALTACGGAAEPPEVTRAEGVEARSVAVTDAQSLEDVVAATRALGVVTLAAAPATDSAVVSPSSLAAALAMLAEGSNTHTLAELEEALGATGEFRRDAFGALRGALAEHEGDPHVVQEDELPDVPVLHQAAQVVVDEGFEVEPTYLTVLADVFDAGTLEVDLGSSAGTAALGDWVRWHSGGLVEDTAIEPDPDQRLVLQDAVVLAARWQAPFDATSTLERDFTLADGTVVEAETMAGTLVVAHAEVDGWHAARLPYTEAFHADVVLPPEGTDPAEADAELLTALDAALTDAAAGDVDLRLPRLDLRPEPVDLRPVLDEVAPSLTQAPDLSGITPDVPLVVGQAVQQAVLQVDEDGTVAAAVTEVALEETSAVLEPDAVELYLDRPFLLTVAHTDTAWPLFYAAVRDPR